MKRKRWLVVVGLIVVAAVVGAEGYRQWRRRAFEDNFARVEAGMTRAQVEALLGPSPDPPSGAYLPSDPLPGYPLVVPPADLREEMADAEEPDKAAESLAYMSWREGDDLYVVSFSTTSRRVVQKVRAPRDCANRGCCREPTFLERLREYLP
jgi:hypothetical protein